MARDMKPGQRRGAHAFHRIYPARLTPLAAQRLARILLTRWRIRKRPRPSSAASPTAAQREAYCDRIETLRGYANSDEISVQPGSEQDFWAFVESLPEAPKAEVVLMDNGNFRAIWEDPEQGRLAIQFMGAQRGEYVIFKRRPDASDISRAAGIDTLDGIKRQLGAFDLMPVTSA